MVFGMGDERDVLRGPDGKLLPGTRKVPGSGAPKGVVSLLEPLRRILAQPVETDEGEIITVQEELMRNLVKLSKRGDQTGVRALEVVLNRVHGPVRQDVDLHVTRDTTIILTPTEGGGEPPTLPDGLELFPALPGAPSGAVDTLEELTSDADEGEDAPHEPSMDIEEATDCRSVDVEGDE